MGNHQGESREALLEMIMRYCRLREGGCGSSCHDRWVPCMTFACKGSAGAPCLHVQLSSHSGIAWRPAMPWVSLCSARPECRMTDESAVTDRGKFCRSQDLRFGPNGHRRQSFHDERNLKLGSSALSYDFLPVCSFHRPPFTPDSGLTVKCSKQMEPLPLINGTRHVDAPLVSRLHGPDDGHEDSPLGPV